METITFTAIRAQQSNNHQVLSFAAKASDIHKIAAIDRIARDEQGTVTGFQRPQIAKHINEIRDYLKSDEAVLPNPIVVAFTDKAHVEEINENTVRLSIEIGEGGPGLVVDGQQRLTALSGLPEKDFQVFVSALICRDEEELKRQFILINNTKPLPKSLIYELLPSVSKLPDRMSSRACASQLTEVLNYDEQSSLKGMIKQHTNPEGIIADNSIQKVIMNSLSDGVCRELIREEDGQRKCFDIISAFYQAVQDEFTRDWVGHTVKSSRLLHGAGFVSMGYVMEYLYARDKAETVDAFKKGIRPLVDYTAWTSGEWYMGENETRPWNSIQNLHRDILMLASYLTRQLKELSRARVVSIRDERHTA